MSGMSLIDENADDEEMKPNVYYEIDGWFSSMCHVFQTLLRGRKYKIPETIEVFFTVATEGENAWYWAITAEGKQINIITIGTEKEGWILDERGIKYHEGKSDERW